MTLRRLRTHSISPFESNLLHKSEAAFSFPPRGAAAALRGGAPNQHFRHLDGPERAQPFPTALKKSCDCNCL